jgi:hypothetical protein
MSAKLCSVALLTVAPPISTGLEHGERVDRAGAPDVHLDRPQRALGDVGRELARHRPPRLAPHVAQLGLQA